MIVNGYLVVRSDGTMRVNKKAFQLRHDEVAFPLTVLLPDMWGNIQDAEINVVVPDPDPATVTVGEPEAPVVDDESLQEI